MFFKLSTAVLVIASILILPNFIGAGAQSAIRTLNVDAKIRNASRGEVVFQDQTNAQSGDRVQIQVLVEALGSQTSVVARSPLSARFVFASGQSGLLNAGGMALGNMNAGDSRTLSFEAVVTGTIETTVRLNAYAGSVESSEVSDTVNIRVSNAPVGVAPEFQNLIVRNKVMNLTRGETAFKDETGASIGDRLRFEIYIKNQTGVTQTGLSLRYYIPYGRFLFASGNPDLILNGIVIDSLRQGDVKTETFEVTLVAGSGNVLPSTVRVFSGLVPQREATATVLIGAAAEVLTPPSSVAGASTLAGQKTITAINRSLGQDATQAAARPGDVIAFQLVYRNSTGGAENARIETDIRDIMTLARVSNTGGAVVDNGVIRFPEISLNPGAEITQIFEITVLDAAHVATVQDKIMGIIYGNSLLVQVGAGQVAGSSTIQPPRTGASENVAITLAMLATAGYWVVSRRRKLKPELV